MSYLEFQDPKLNCDVPLAVCPSKRRQYGTVSAELRSSHLVANFAMDSLSACEIIAEDCFGFLRGG